MSRTIIKTSNRLGNPNWYKGMPSANPYGRPKKARKSTISKIKLKTLKSISSTLPYGTRTYKMEKTKPKRKSNNPYGRGGKPVDFLYHVGKGAQKFLSSPFSK